MVLAAYRPNRKLGSDPSIEANAASQKVTKETKSALHPLFDKADRLSNVAISSAIEVHRDKGPGLNESIYEWCLMREFELRNIPAKNQQTVRITYKGFQRAEPLRFDAMVDECLLIESKAVERILPLHKAQLLTYMKLLNVPIGLLINFNVPRLVDGVTRLILPGANQ